MSGKLEFGLVGLGKMGSNLALQAMEKGIRVVGFDIGAVPAELPAAGMAVADSPAEFGQQLGQPRIVLVLVPAGPAVDQVLDDVASGLEPGDVLVDGGNSYWGDSIRRHERFSRVGLKFIDLGVSGGVDGAREGACFMAGGEDEAVALIAPILKKLAVPEGYIHAGPPGAGHFVKLVHNGIEFGMLQAIGEGMALLGHFPAPLDTQNILHVWNHGSVIRSWLIELLEQQLKNAGGTTAVPSYVEDTGEVNWLVADALRMEVAIPVISQAVMELFASRDANGTASRAIALMRHGFGGHPFGPAAPIAAERRHGRVGPIYAPVDKTDEN